MDRTRWRLVVACFAVVGAAIAVAGGSASNNRDGFGTLEAIPGPGSVNYGKNIAYKATFTNRNSASGAVFTQVKVALRPPFVDGTSDRATPVATSCGSFDANDVLTCDFGQLRPDESVTLVVVWKAPPPLAADGTPKPGCTGCLVAAGAWSIKEGKLTNSNETFEVSALADLIGVSDTDSVNRNTHGGSYELEGCGADNPTSLETNQAIDATTNPVTTSFCIPASFTADGAAGGVTATIAEPSGGPSFARHSDVCISKPGTQCGNPNYQPQDFSPDDITFRFTVSDEALDDQIKDVSHNGVVLKLCTKDPDNANGCIIDILKPNGSQAIPVWVILARASINGPWDW